MGKTKDNKYQSIFTSMNIHKYLLVSVISLVVFFGLAGGAEAANHYIRSGATGANNGSDWTNAWTSLPSNLTRGDTYYIAGGTYTREKFNTPESGSLVITIKGATIADHGTDTGWSNSYSVNTLEGGTQATWNSTLYFSTSYWVFDGSVGPLWSKVPSQYGFSMGTIRFALYIYNTSKSISNITISHLAATAPPDDVQKMFQDTISDTKSVNYVTISHCYADGYENFIRLNSNHLTMEGWVIEYNIFLRGYNSSTWHGEEINNDGGYANNTTVRYNWFEGRTQGTAMIVVLNAQAGPWYIYGNVFKDMVFGDGGITGITNTFGTQKMTGVVYNNTFINAQAPTRYNYGKWVGYNTTGVTVYNNLCYNMSADYGSPGPTTHDYNSFFSTIRTPTETHGQVASTNPFTADGITLIEQTDPGITLPDPYNVDAFGNTRGSDGIWDRGALEYVSGPPQSEYNLTVAKSGAGSGTVSGTGINCGSDCAETIDTGTSVTLTASADSDSVFSGWSGGGGGCSGTGTCTVTMNSNTTVTASFNQPGLQVNLLTNGDFESGFTSGLANNWQMTTDGSISYSASQDTGHQGSGQKITVTTPGSWGLFFYQNPSFQLNQSYTWSFWYKTQEGDLWAQITDPPANQVVFQKQLSDTNGEWQQAAYTFQYTNSGANQLRFYSNTAGTYWLDDIQLVVGADDSIPPAAPTGLVVQ